MEQPFDGLDEMLRMPSPTKNREERPLLVESLPASQQQQAQQLAETIDVLNFEKMLAYGSDAQLALSRFSNHLLAQIQRKEQTGVSNVLEQLTDTLEQINPQSLQPQQGGFLKKFFKKSPPPVQQLMSKYKRVSVQIDRLAIQLERSKLMLLRDLTMLDTLFEQNKQYFDALNLYIAAAEIKRNDLLYEYIPQLEADVARSEDPMAQQQLKDWYAAIERFEARIYDLEMARMMTIQNAPQIRLIQETSRTLADKIQTSVQTAIPIWKTQISLTLTLHEQQKSLRQHAQLDDISNLLETKNPEMLALAQRGDIYDTHTQLLANIQDTIALERKQLETKKNLQLHTSDAPLSRMAKRQQP